VHLCVFDLDHFKQINDTHGHMTGDAALKLVVGIARESLRSEDLLGRFGGDEFMIAGMDRSSEQMLELMNEIRIHVKQRAEQGNGAFSGMSLSMGVAQANANLGYTRDDLFHRADSAVYTAKRAGRNRVVNEDDATILNSADTHPLRNLEETSSNT
jgi:diguanylate cyclase (GGDEF)-like protein